VTAGSSGVADPTDKDGHAFVQGLAPYEKVLVSVDESSLPDPFLVMRGKGVVVTPRPGVPAVIELAVAPTGEVEGTLLAPEGTAADPILPSASLTSASTVGLPRLSRIWRARTATIVVAVMS